MRLWSLWRIDLRSLNALVSLPAVMAVDEDGLDVGGGRNGSRTYELSRMRLRRIAVQAVGYVCDVGQAAATATPTTVTRSTTGKVLAAAWEWVRRTRLVAASCGRVSVHGGEVISTPEPEGAPASMCCVGSWGAGAVCGWSAAREAGRLALGGDDIISLFL